MGRNLKKAREGASHAHKWAKHSGRGNISTKLLRGHTPGMFGDSKEAHVTDAEEARSGVLGNGTREEMQSQIISAILRTSASIQSDMGSYCRVLNRTVT